MEKLILYENRNEIDREKPYTAETFRQVALNKLERLYAIRDLMESDGYARKKRKYQRESEKLAKAIEKLTKHIGKFEAAATAKIMNDDSLAPEQKQRKLAEEVYPVVHRMQEAVESTDEYLAAVNAFREFKAANLLMDDSVMYNLKRTTPEAMPFVNLADFLAGEETEEIEFEMPSDCIYDEIDKQEKYANEGYLADYAAAVAEDKRQKALSRLQLEYLFGVCDTVCFHAESGVLAGDEEDVRFADIVKEAYRTEETQNRGMQVLRIYLKPSEALKNYLLSFVRFDRYHYDVSLRFEPYCSFADILFLNNKTELLSCVTHEGYFDVHNSVRPVFDGFEKQLN